MTGLVHYFAFGSNINLAHLRGYVACAGLVPDGISHPRRAVLHNHRLRTNYHSVIHGAGACNLEPRPGAIVEGIVMTITPPVLNLLRTKEGHPVRYQETEIEVHLVDTGEPLSAITYVVASARRLPHDVPVTARYRALVLCAADEVGLSDAYQASLRSLLRVEPETT